MSKEVTGTILMPKEGFSWKAFAQMAILLSILTIGAIYGVVYRVTISTPEVMNALNLHVGSTYSLLAKDYDYIIAHPLGDNTITCMQNGTTGVLDGYSSNASANGNNALGNLTGTSLQKILFKDDFTFDSPLLVRSSYVKLTIDGTITLASGVNDYAIKSVGSLTDVTIEGGILQCNSAGQTAGGGIFFSNGVGRLTIRDTKIWYPYAYGIYIDGGGSRDAWVQNIQVYYAGSIGIVCSGGRNVFISGCGVYNATIEGFRIYNPNDYRAIYKLTDNEVYGGCTLAGYKFDCESHYAVMIATDCSVTDTLEMGFQNLHGKAILTGCHTYGTYHAGFSLEDGSWGCELHGCVSRGTKAAPPSVDQHGVDVVKTENVFIDGGSFENMADAGIEIYDSNNTRIIGVTCTNNSQDATDNTYSGIVIRATAGYNVQNTTIIGACLLDTQAVPTQTYGIREWNDGGTVNSTTISTCTFSGNPTIVSVATGSHPIFDCNIGFVTENTILNVANTTATTFVFNHGCASTVNSVQCSFDLTIGFTWTWTSTTTQVTVTVTPHAGVTLPATMHILSADEKYIP